MASQNSTSQNSMSSVISTMAAPLEQPAETVQQVTQFVDDTGLQTASLPAPADVAPDILASGSEDRVHEIADVLERPVVVSTVEWADTQGFDTLLPISPGTPSDISTLNFPQALFDASPNLADKINYFAFLRARLVVRIVVNSNPFQLGKLIAYFAPYSSQDDIGNRTLVNSFMSARSAFPHIVLDAGTGNSGELCIPFVSYYTHWNLPEDLGNLGNLQVAVLNPLQSGTCNLTIFARFTNVHLEVPTAKPSTLSTSMSLDHAIRTAIQRYGARAVRSRVRRIHAQVDEGKAKDSRGVISTILGTVSSMSSMGTSLPVIGKYLAPISWVTGAASQVAQYFGLSKPINLTQQHRLSQLPAYGFTNTDGSDTSLSLSASCENSIGHRADVFGTSRDDMDIAYVAGHSCYLTQFTWDATDTVGTIVGDVNVTPGSMQESITTGDDIYDSTLLGYVASMFRYWRGSIKFKIQAAKTAYHSGRLRISFVPLGGAGETAGYRMDQAYSEILDLRISNEIEMNIDYLSNTVYKEVDLVKFDSNVSTSVATGILRIEVLNRLVHPDSVANNVGINVWIGGGSDIAFAVPEFNRFYPVAPDAVSALSFQRKPQAQVYDHIQSPGFDASIQDSPDMFMPRKTSTLDSEITCIGEHIQSLRQLTRRFGRLTAVSAAEDSIFKMGSAWFGDVPSASSPQADLVPVSPIFYISWLYRFFRGSVRLKCVNLGDANGVISADTSVGRTAFPTPPSVTNVSPASRNLEITGGAAFTHFVDLRYNNSCEISVPYYNNTHVSLLRGEGAVVTPAMEKQSDIHFSFPPGNYRFLHAAGDDFSFGWIVGPPKLRRRGASDALSADVDYGLASNISFTGDPIASGTLSLSPVSVPAGTYSLIGTEQSFNVEYYPSSVSETVLLDFDPNISLTANASGYVTNNWNQAVGSPDGDYKIVAPASEVIPVTLLGGAVVTIPVTVCRLVVNAGIAQFQIVTTNTLDIAATQNQLTDLVPFNITFVPLAQTPSLSQAIVPAFLDIDVFNSIASIPFDVDPDLPVGAIVDVSASLENAQNLGVISYVLAA
nr:hypothetical protein 2 [Wenzhou picorna-like virus 29]